MDVPFIFVTGFGAGESKNYVPWMVKLFLKYLLKDVYADKTKMEEIITNSDLNWTVVRPGRLLDKELTEKYRIENTLFKGINIGGINREDVADFLIKQAEKQTELKKYIALSEKQDGIIAEHLTPTLLDITSFESVIHKIFYSTKQ